MNCLLQKSLKDKVFVNRCVLDSILWFHLECPRAASKFDDPVEFKRKFRDFFAHNVSVSEATSNSSQTKKRMNEQFGFHQGYPEDINTNAKVNRIGNELEAKFSPKSTPDSGDEEDPNAERGVNFVQAKMENKDILYGKRAEHLQQNPIPLSASAAGREDLMQ